MERLSRGVVAVKTDDDRTFISWRLLATDPDRVAFNIYRRGEDGHASRINSRPLDGATNIVDGDGKPAGGGQYFVRAVVDGVEQAASKAAKVWDAGYLGIPVQPVEGYRPSDGEYEIVLHQVSRARDNSHSGLTDPPIFDAYTWNGKHLWRINLGRNIREGEHYTQFMVYDLDGDGKAEFVCKTADGTTDGRGKVIGDKDKDWRTTDPNSRAYGRILAGPEHLTVFDGKTGAALQTVDYIPGREPIDGWGGIGGNGNNDDYGNRCDRFLACIAYLDGRRPSVVMCRGVYGRTVLVAWDWRDGKLTKRWVFDSGVSHPPFKNASPYSGMGGHSLAVADVDGDGKDEIVYHSMVVDDDGNGLYSTGLRHGDSLHVSDMDPLRPGLEVFTIHETEGRTARFNTPGAVMRDARTGEILWSHSPGVDVGAGLAADIDPRHPGYEAWGGPGGLRTAAGKQIGPAPRSTRFAIWWDGDKLRELLSGGRVTKWNWKSHREEPLFNAGGRGRFRGASLVGDLMGDWREEILIAGRDGRSLRLYTTTIPTNHRLRTLMQDPQYRLSIAWQNAAYNKPPHPGFFLGHDAPSPKPSIPIVP